MNVIRPDWERDHTCLCILGNNLGIKCYKLLNKEVKKDAWIFDSVYYLLSMLHYAIESSNGNTDGKEPKWQRVCCACQPGPCMKIVQCKFGCCCITVFFLSLLVL